MSQYGSHTMPERLLKRMWAKADQSYTHRVNVPVVSKLSPQTVDRDERRMRFLRLPNFDGTNCWCFETADDLDYFRRTYLDAHP